MAASALIRWAALIAGAEMLAAASGCTWLTYLGTTDHGEENGKTFYLGGAGPFGHVGTIDVPNGLRSAGYRGAIEVFGWQSVIPSTLLDHVYREKNERESQRLVEHITDYLNRYPGRRVNIIALSAGSGIATWALERLPEGYEVGTIVYLGSSLSRDYDLSPALRIIRGRLYNFYCATDPVLRYGVPIAGTVDRDERELGPAGLFRFIPPVNLSAPDRALYEARLKNMAYRQQWSRYGYRGQHTDATSARFIAKVIAPLILEPLPPADGIRPAEPSRRSGRPAPTTPAPAPLQIP